MAAASPTSQANSQVQMPPHDSRFLCKYHRRKGDKSEGEDGLLRKHVIANRCAVRFPCSCHRTEVNANAIFNEACPIWIYDNVREDNFCVCPRCSQKFTRAQVIPCAAFNDELKEYQAKRLSLADRLEREQEEAAEKAEPSAVTIQEAPTKKPLSKQDWCYVASIVISFASIVIAMAFAPQYR